MDDNINNDVPKELNLESVQPTQHLDSQHQPTQTMPTLTPPVHSENSPGIIILQWLTYAFWGWTILALAVLLTTVISHLIAGAETGGFTPYGIAAVLVLLPISVVCDYFYGRKEPVKKSGVAAVVMVIHAVIFSLFGIGSLIAFVFSIVSLATSRTDSATTTVSLISSISIALLYAITLLRTIKPKNAKWIPRVYMGIMVAVSLTIIVMAFVGPIASERLTRNDRLIVNNIGEVTSAIDSYSKDNRSLPGSLSQITINGTDTKKLISDNLLAYTPNTKQPTTLSSTSYSSRSKVYYYSICVDYKKADPSSATTYTSNVSSVNTDYSTNADAYTHPAGHVCYKINTQDY